MMKRFIAIVLVLLFVLPTLAPWLPHDALDALHTQQEAHHQDELSHTHHDDHHAIFADNEFHPVHFDIVSYFDNLHVDLKNPPVAKLIAPVAHVQDMPFIPVTDIFAESIISWAPRQSQGPPMPPDTQVVSSSVPVYLATQRLRI